MPIDPRQVRLETRVDGGVNIMYGDWYVATITRRGSLRRASSCAHEDIQHTTHDGSGKIRLVR